MADWTNKDELMKEVFSNGNADTDFHFFAEDTNDRIFDHVTCLDDVESYQPNLLARTPGTLRDFKEIQEIAKAAEPELKLLVERMLRWHYNIFPRIASEDGIREWEDWLGLLRSVRDTLDERRFRIITKANERLPYTWVQLHRMLAGIVGWDNYDLELNELELTVRISTDSGSKFNSITDLLSRVLPQYLLWNVNIFNRAKTTVYTGGVLREVIGQHFKFDDDKDLLFTTTSYVGGVERNATLTHHAKLDISDIA